MLPTRARDGSLWAARVPWRQEGSEGSGVSGGRTRDKGGVSGEPVHTCTRDEERMGAGWPGEVLLELKMDWALHKVRRRGGNQRDADA